MSCLRYARGVADGLIIAQMLDEAASIPQTSIICVPKLATSDQIVEVGLRYWDTANPVTRSLRASQLLAEALLKTWPCSKERTPWVEKPPELIRDSETNTLRIKHPPNVSDLWQFEWKDADGRGHSYTEYPGGDPRNKPWWPEAVKRDEEAWRIKNERQQYLTEQERRAKGSVGAGKKAL